MGVHVGIYKYVMYYYTHAHMETLPSPPPHQKKRKQREEEEEVMHDLALRQSLTSENVKLYTDLAKRHWKKDPEDGHRLEFHIRSRVLKEIAKGRLEGSHARNVCTHLIALEKMTPRWFA